MLDINVAEASNAGLIAGLTVGLLFIIGVSIFVAIVARRRHTNMKKENGKNSGRPYLSFKTAQIVIFGNYVYMNEYIIL